MTEREWQRYNEWKNKWATENEWYRQIIQDNEHLSNDIVELKYDPEKRQYIGRYIKQGREEVEGGGLDQYETVEDMSLDFLNDILHPVFVELVKIYKGMFLKIPLGESRPDYVKSGEKRFLKDLHLRTKVLVHFQQGSKDYCFPYSIASCLVYAGYPEAANAFKIEAERLSALPRDLAVIQCKRMMLQYCPAVGQCTIFNSRTRNRKKRELTLSQLCSQRSPFPMVVVLRGIDNSISHAVTVIDDLVFDSTQEYALKLTLESLDFICLQFKGVGRIEEAYHFCQRVGKQKWTRKPIQNWSSTPKHSMK